MGLSSDLNSAQLRAVLQTALDAVVVMRTDGTVAGWNDVAAATFGWSFGEAEGKRMSELIIPERLRAAHEIGLARYLSTGKGPVLDRRFEIEALHRKGHELPVELSITHTNDFGQPVFLGFLRDISERHEHERRRSLLVSELNHRVKNLLGVVDALARQTLRSTSSPEEFAAAFAGRLKNLGAAHEILTDASWERASLPMLVRRTFATLPIDKTQLTLDGPEATLSPRQFLSLSLILHELTTNALKYGALADVEGRIHLQWQLTGNELSLRWREYGEKEVTKPTRIGFGTKMVDTSVSSELRGHCERVWHKNGLELRLKFEIE